MKKILKEQQYTADGRPIHAQPVTRDSIVLVNRCDKCCSLTYYEQVGFKRTERVSCECPNCGKEFVKRFYQYQRRAYEVEVPSTKG